MTTTQNDQEGTCSAPQGAEAPGKAIGDLAQPDAATVEQVARLICSTIVGDTSGKGWDMLDDIWRGPYYAAARAVLAWYASAAQTRASQAEQQVVEALGDWARAKDNPHDYTTAEFHLISQHLLNSYRALRAARRGQG